MSTHNMFSSRNKKNIDTLWLKKAPYQELCLLIFKNSILMVNLNFLGYCIYPKYSDTATPYRTFSKI